MTSDQLAAIVGAISAHACMTDDDKQGDEQETVNKFYAYLDTTIPATQQRFDPNSPNHYKGMDFSGGSTSSVDTAAVTKALSDNGVNLAAGVLEIVMGAINK